MNKAILALAAVTVFAAGVASTRWFGAGEPAPPGAVTGERKPLYYRNPMGLADVSPVPKKDSMGMDYIPVYAGEEGTESLVRIAPERVQLLGVHTEAAALRVLSTDIQAVGIIEADERGLSMVAPRVEGWIETLYADTTGQAVRRGDPLFAAYSPALVTAQQEYLLALEAQRGTAPALGAELLATARSRLLNWEFGAAEIRALERSGEPARLVTYRALRDGVVLEKTAVAGMRFMPGEVLYRLADLRRVWLIASVYERDLAALATGQAVNLVVDAFPERRFEGRVEFVQPTLDEATRTVRVRAVFDNADAALRPGMFGRAHIRSAVDPLPVLSIPDTAVIDSGERQVVLVQRGAGAFEPRELALGRRGDGYVEVLRGIEQGEQVVVRANFLIDAESNLRSALEGFGHGGHGAAPADAGATADPSAASAHPAGHPEH